MSEPIRYEHAERVRDFYRNQGAVKEQERIIKLIEESNKQYAQPSEESEALWGIIALIKGENK